MRKFRGKLTHKVQKAVSAAIKPIIFPESCLAGQLEHKASLQRLLLDRKEIKGILGVAKSVSSHAAHIFFFLSLILCAPLIGLSLRMPLL